MRTKPSSHLRSALWLAIAPCTAAWLAACSDSDSASDPPADASTPDSPPGDPNAKCAGTTTDAWVADDKLCVYEFAADLGPARQMAFAPNGDLFISNGSKITVLADDDGDGKSAASERTTFVEQNGLNHGLAFSRDAAYIYGSNATTVWRWGYTAGARTAAGDAEVIVDDIPGTGHSTRTLVFDSQGRLYVSVGSAENVDSKPNDLATRAQIRRFDVTAGIPTDGFAYEDGEIVASGMRNEVGLYMDARDRMWGVENGRDQLSDDGVDIHNGNPGEEINLIDGTGPQYYGYPSCFTEFDLAGGNGAGTQWADPTLAAGALKTDDWCRDATQVHPPAFALPAHWAPLGVLEYQGSLLPWGNDLIVASHGSWNAEPQVGRVIARVHRGGDTLTRFEPIIGERGGDGQLRQGTWNVRPVDVREAADGSVYFSDDNSGRVFKISYAR